MRRSQRAAARKAVVNMALQQSASASVSAAETHDDDEDTTDASLETTPITSFPSDQDEDDDDDEEEEDVQLSPPPPPAKRRKITSTSKASSSSSKKPTSRPRPRQATTTFQSILTTTTTTTTSLPNKPFIPPSLSPSLPPHRHHPLAYHHPLLLSSPSHSQSPSPKASRLALLTWFTKVYTTRPMPWRKPFLPPSQTPRPLLAKRAYEVWISEIMLQQTRVAAVVSYYEKWMARWPTISDLASASPDEVLSAWRGLGYYGRARRVHEAAKLVCSDAEMDGLLPGDVRVLEARVPGVGRYTAGAIAAIVFGRPAAMVDGNVLRVLSRQVGVFGDVKERRVVEALWEVAEALVRAVARDDGGDEKGPEEEGKDGGKEEEEERVSDRPGRWGQALMELGSTVCTPKPNCAECPITATCRAYQEGYALAMEHRAKQSNTDDIEDLCTLCSPFEEETADLDSDLTPKPPNATKGKSKSRKTISPFFTDPTNPPPPPQTNGLLVQLQPDGRAWETTITNHARKFPLKKPKKTVREEHTLVCAIRRSSDGNYLIHRRPEKGLLGGMWELPSQTLPSSNDSTTKARKVAAAEYVAGLGLCADANQGKGKGKRRASSSSSSWVVKHMGELDSIPWLFSHLKLTMHVHLFVLEDGSHELLSDTSRSRWASSEEIDRESMGTGMRKCWALVKEQM